MVTKISSHWERLPRWIRVAIFGVVFAVALVAAPELVPLLDLGGIELALLAIISYYKPFLRFATKQIRTARILLACLHTTLMHSSLVQPKVFFAFSAVAVVFMVVTGSVIPVHAIWLPAFVPQCQIS